MEKIFLIIYILFMVNSLGFAQQQEKNLVETITAKEKEMYEAIKSGNMETYQSNLADEFVSVYNSGIVEREQEIENISKLMISEYEMSDIRVRQPTEGVAIITYALAGSGTYDEEEFDSNYYSASTWIKSADGSWKIAFHAETEAIVYEDPIGRE